MGPCVPDVLVRTSLTRSPWLTVVVDEFQPKEYASTFISFMGAWPAVEEVGELEDEEEGDEEERDEEEGDEEEGDEEPCELDVELDGLPEPAEGIPASCAGPVTHPATRTAAASRTAATTAKEAAVSGIAFPMFPLNPDAYPISVLSSSRSYLFPAVPFGTTTEPSDRFLYGRLNISTVWKTYVPSRSTVPTYFQEPFSAGYASTSPFRIAVGTRSIP